MPLTKLQFRPGINREVSSYTNEGGWYDCSNVRFQKGFPEKIGGWQKRSFESFLGTCRGLHPWVTLDQDQFIAVGTHLKYYIEQGGAFNDITPIRETTSAGAVTFTATDGSSRILVSHTAHGAVVNDFVTFSGAVSLGGNITADILNQEYEIVEVPDADTYYIDARTVSTIGSITVDGALSPTLVTANSSDSGNGGASVVGAYQINSGLDTQVGGAGWGAGAWGRAGWGDPGVDPIVQNTLRIWSQDNFGEDLLINVRNGGIYYWDASSGLGSRAVDIRDLPGSNSAPQFAKQVLVSDRDRHVIAFGCDSQTNPGVQDPLLIRFSDQENVLDWESTALNTAGDLRLGSGSEIITAVETRQQVLVYTDTTLYAMQYLGPPFTFGVNAISEQITIMSPNAVASVNDQVFWMGESEFYAYGGAVQRLPCTVRDYVFSDLNTFQREKVYAGVNTEHSEVWWFYPSSDSDDVNRYVVYNYLENSWYFGDFGRTAWIDRGIFDLPVAAFYDGYLYYHEVGFDDGTFNPAEPIVAYVRSSPMDLGDGEQFTYVSRMLPDIQFKNSVNVNPTVDLTVRVRNFPGGEYLKTTNVSFSDGDEIKYLRLRGRQFSIYVESSQLGVTWRYGTTRLDLKPDGRR
jgi:hypothetical protein